MEGRGGGGLEALFFQYTPTVTGICVCRYIQYCYNHVSTSCEELLEAHDGRAYAVTCANK